MQHIFISKLSDTDAWSEKIHNMVKIGREYTENLKNGRSTWLQPADRGGAAPGAGLHVSPRPRRFSLVSGKVMT